MVPIDARPLPKDERQRLLASLIARKRIGTQQELLAALERAGCTATQATVSRDLRELGATKIDDELGRPRLVLPQPARRVDPHDQFASVLSQYARRVTAAQSLVVILSELGSAPAIARTLDRSAHPLVVATLAGDDTCLVVTRSPKDARALAAELAALL